MNKQTVYLILVQFKGHQTAQFLLLFKAASVVHTYSCLAGNIQLRKQGSRIEAVTKCGHTAWLTRGTEVISNWPSFAKPVESWFLSRKQHQKRIFLVSYFLYLNQIFKNVAPLTAKPIHSAVSRLKNTSKQKLYWATLLVGTIPSLPRRRTI